jgi:23S rRNA (pseudouridine1915-N3)-methyltransferase
MSGVLVIWVGKRAPRGLEELAEDYAGRISRHLPFAQVRVRPAAGRRDSRRALAEEGAAIQGYLDPSDTVVALDEHGRERTTEALATWLSERRRHGRTVFVIGSDLGLDSGLKGSARELLALSRLTLPHQLARLVLLEQLYRACDLLAGGQYHRGDQGWTI